MNLSNYTPLALAVFSTEVSAYLSSAGWSVAAGTATTGGIKLANKFIGDKAALIVAGQQGALHLVDTISACIDSKSGEKEDIKTSGSFCLAYNHFHSTGSWGKREDMLAHLNEYFDQMPEYISLSDIHYEGLPLNNTHLPQSLSKRDGSQYDIRIFHNSSMPLSFTYHNTKCNHVPLVVATNGTHTHIGHLAPVSQNNTTSTRYLNRQTDFNPDFTRRRGRRQGQCNSKYATMTELQVQQFMDDPLSSTTKKAGLSVS